MRLRLFAGLALLTLATAASLAAEVARAADTPEARQQAAERLFELPAYREVATRQVYEAIRSLPDAQYRSAVEALSDPKVIRVLREVIVHSMARTFTVGELESLGRYMATDEARSTVAKTDTFQDALLREFLAAGLSHPEIGKYLVPR
jgi:hypothetical protein